MKIKKKKSSEFIQNNNNDYNHIAYHPSVDMWVLERPIK